MLEDGEAPLRLNLIDDVADTDRPKEQGLPSVRPTDLAGGPPGLKMSFVTAISPSQLSFIFKGHLISVACRSEVVSVFVEFGE